MNQDNSDWLEPVLSRGLGKVEAPEELWERVHRPAALREKGARRDAGGAGRFAWAFAAAALTVVAALGLLVHESHAAGSVELRSGDPAQVRNWVWSNAGLDLALPEVLGPSVRLLSARVVNPALPSVEVAYRIGDRELTLLVARSSGGSGFRHADLSTAAGDGKITWVAHGQVYALSCAGPEDAHVACLLCHAS